MLTHTQDLGYRAAQYAITPLSKKERDNTLAALKHHYGSTAQSAFIPKNNEEAIRIDLAQAAPSLKRLGEDLREKLDRDHSLIMLSRTWIDDLDTDQRAALLFSLALQMGSPTPTDQVDKKVVWDIRALGDKMKSGHVPTFSEHADEACLHTDTQYYPAPERFMLLYYNHPAACGGGLSYCRDISCIKDEMAKTADGRWALNILETTDLPFRIPTTFTSDKAQDTCEVTFAPILSQTPHVRYRKDTLERGFALHPEYKTADVEKALSLFTQELNRADKNVSAFVQRDQLLAINNHECLHGRSEFKDIQRHAFRIRIQDRQNLT
ncbi:TauD/TfdA family dioxygenase [Terasakiella pusilla]|jgi:alpha-ketoglutarate-dependent taurine dioxygenase|uniref:TauD/TfdA family dioxygenase n=1 Tax=Terasakiella pusilla TaxID=64973 RepID=UPI003AA7B846